MTRKNCTGVILAGGRNSRMGGENKAFIKVGGERIIDRTVALFRHFFDDIILVTNNPSAYTGVDALVVSDIYKNRCSLAGIHAGLFYAQTPWVFVAPCDNPFLKKEMVALVLDHIRPGFNVVIPETAKGLEPLCAAYGKSNLNNIEKNLKEGRLKIRQFFKASHTRKIPEKKILEVDPSLVSFFNINTPGDITVAEALKGLGSNNFHKIEQHQP